MRSVGYRIAATTALVFAAIAVGLGGVAMLVAHVGLARTLDVGIERAATSLITVYHTQGRARMIAAVHRDARERHDGLGYVVFDASGRRLIGDLAIERPLPGWSDTYFYDPIEGQDPARVLASELPGGELLVVGGDRRPVELANIAIVWLFGASVIVMLILCAIMALVLGRYLQDRLSRISETSDAVIAGDLSRRVPLRGSNDEFDRIAASLNAMLDRIAELVNGIRRVSADVAHDLKTPLTRLRARTEQALIVHPGPSPHRAALERGIEQIDEVLATFDAMLRIAELEEGKGGPLCERVNLGPLVADIKQTLAPVFADEGRNLTLHVDAAAAVCGDPALLTAAIANLLENVLRHTPAGTGAMLTATIVSNSVEVSVADDGPGVRDDALPRLFDRFYRIDSARSRGGRGLGLSLVAAIAKTHEGVARAENGHPGLKISMLLPQRDACADKMA